MNPADGLGQPSSLTARRPAAGQLPNFQLPPPELSGLSKYPSISGFSVPQTSPGNVGNLLTPPSHAPGDNVSPMSSSMHSAGSGNSSAGIPPYPSVGGMWQPPSSTSPYGFSSAPPSQAAYASQSLPPGFPVARSVFSPSLGSMVRNASSPATADGLPPPSYDLPPFPTAAPLSGSSGSSLPNLSGQPNNSVIAATLMNSHSAATTTATQPSPIHAPESFHPRPPPTPSYYGSQPPSAQQASFPPTYTAPSPNQSSPASRVSPTTSQTPHQNAMTAASQYPRGFGYQLPAMPGTILSNLHSPGGQMALCGMQSGMIGPYAGAAGQIAHMYGAAPTHGQAASQGDRPFKCDQCPQSFNRNHDLKRHKRIHLAVKPFPCGHCDKSFSRKDALKRHVLVKGCGKASSGQSKQEGSDSPHEKSENTSSDGGDQSPVMNGAGPVKSEA